MVPWVLLLSGGYLAITDGFPERAAAPPARFRFSGSALSPAALRAALASASARSVTTVGAVGVVLVGAAPMATATVARNADPIVAQALAGASAPLDRSAPGFRLVSQSGQPVSLASLRGKVVLLTFLDPVCSDCLTIAREMKAAGTLLGASAENVELVAIAADSTHFRPVFIRAFDRQGGLATVPNWLFLTGTLDQLQRVWNQYETVAPDLMAGMTPRSDVIFVVGKDGRIRREINDAAASASAAARSSFPVLLADAARYRS
jgi:cytochrome oxidase Cu insertion factor (SCO1/SenC/PrrC family)